jgi:hypothetical protein
MTHQEIKAALLKLSTAEQKAFVLETLPDLAGDLVKEPGFMMELFPVLLGILKKSGMDLQQLMQLATMLNSQQQQQ